MEVNGWKLFQHPLFSRQFDELDTKVRELVKKDPLHFAERESAKLLSTVRELIYEIIPRDPTAREFRQGNTLGPDNRHWFRAKFHRRFRLFFRFSSKDKVIVYTWMNDEGTLRKASAKTDPYAVFRAMLERDDPPRSIEELLRRSSPLEKDPKV